ncbi:hypothetical protein wTpre_1114 [Wolbachia endosymbiont of Trichogramma pretiosum]|nr:hypothetical protein wTpre_1114 [Wolbachia endosymbiont of Trichogramma pretiosum]
MILTYLYSNTLLFLHQKIEHVQGRRSYLGLILSLYKQRAHIYEMNKEHLSLTGSNFLKVLESA